MKKFWELVQESVVVQGVLTVGVTALVCTMAYKGQPVPDNLWTLLGLAWGFYFGTKGQQAIIKATTK